MDIDYGNILRENVKMEDRWNIEDIYENKKAWLLDKKKIKTQIDKIENLKQNWLDNENNMYDLLELTSSIEEKLSKLYTYANCLEDTDMEKSEYQEMKGLVENIVVEYSSIISFMRPDILNLDKENLKQYKIKKPEIKKYDMKLDMILRQKEHILDYEREKILSMTNLFGENPEKASSMLNDVEIPRGKTILEDGKEIELNFINFITYRESKNRNDRINVTQKFWKSQSKFVNTQAILLDSIVKKHFFNSKNRNYKNCLQASLFPNKIENEVYLNLIKTTKKNLHSLHGYMKLKEKMLGLDNIKYEDVYASSIPNIEKEYTIQEAIDVVIEAMNPLGEKYTEVLKKGFTNRWMDIYPNKGKRSGAYSNGSVYDGHPYVLMNFKGNYNDVSTLAHEFGHALHSYFSNKNNSYVDSDYPIFLAEIASTFNEDLLIEYILENSSDREFKMYVLDKYLEGIRAGFFRQTLFAEFELKIHEYVESGNTLTSDWLNKLYLELTKEYYGHNEGITEVGDFIQYEWSWVPHFYYNFYVYQYSTGIAASSSLSEKVLKDKNYNVSRYLEFLKSGGKDYPLNILEKAGVDLTSPKPIKDAIEKFTRRTKQLEELYDENQGE